MNIEIISIDEFNSSERSMTREEAINILEMFLHKQCDLKRTEFAYDANTIWHAVNMASKALKQKFCNDCISRQAVLNKAFEIKTGENTSAMVVYAEDIRKELPVLPKREQGEWIEEKHGYRCNKCNKFYKGEWSITDNAMIPHKCCPNCGAEMIFKSCSTCKHDGELVCTTHGCHNKERYEEK